MKMMTDYDKQTRVHASLRALVFHPDMLCVHLCVRGEVYKLYPLDIGLLEKGQPLVNCLTKIDRR